MSPAPKRQVKVVVDGKTYVVEVGDTTVSPTTVIVNGKAHQVDLQTIETRAAPGKPGEKAAVPTAPAPAPADVSPQVQMTGTGGVYGEVRAPMPGTIVEIYVKPGDQISIRQELCALEAMKMKNAIRANREGVIASVEVTEGQSVTHGQVLFTYE
jgi:biotin carboxyl carrier protein